QNERFAHYEPEYSTIYGARYRFTGKELDRETGYTYNEQRYLCTDYGFWTRVDPLVDKYLNISPYAYCNNNPLKYIDPDGRKSVYPKSDNVDESNRRHMRGDFLDVKNPSVIHVFGHGDSSGNFVETKTKLNSVHVKNANDYSTYLKENSEIWQSYLESGQTEFTIVVFHSCQVGKAGCFAQQFSEENPNVLVVAPNANLRIYSEEEERIDNTEEGVPGAWIFYIDGKCVNSMSGTTAPIFDVERNKNKYQSKDTETETTTD
ncbi:MAG: RHS repeat-associated core domain-containing protein, partial [Paludibacteraceae bacterium]|nr:RHS repeat-associated core domain-containing protein [Paludibacteraceae bacterium]